MLKVYGRSDSSNSAKVFWLLQEMGVPYERIDCGGKFGGNDEPAYLAMNPHGKVPTVVDGDFVVWESNAVLRYLASQYEAIGYWPQSAGGRATIDKWMDWSATALVPPLGRLRKAIKADGDEAKILVQGVVSAFSLLDRRLADNDYIAGDSFSLADISAAPAIHRWFLLPLNRPALPNLNAYHDRLAERPAFIAHIRSALT